LRAAVFISPENVVLLSSRREWLDRPLDLAAIGLAPGEQTRVAATMQQARQTGRVVSQLSADRNELAIVMPAAVPLGPSDLRLDRRALILLVHDLSFAKSVNRFRLRQQFGVAMLGVLVAVLGLGVALHFFVTRRIERLHGTMARFAVGEPVENEPTPSSKRADEISHLFRHFTAIASTINRETGVRRQAEHALRESEERFRSAMHHSPIGMALISTEARFLEVNPALCAILGYSREELLATTFQALTHPDDLNTDTNAMTRMLNREIDTFRRVKRYFHKDGRVLWALLNSSLVTDEDGQARYFVSQVQDITESRRADEELRRVNRSLRTISNCNQVLVHAMDESSLLHQLCEVIVRDGGYRMAWVGLADSEAENVVHPVAHAGFEDGYLERLSTSWSGEGGGPTMNAIRSRRPAVCHDFLSDSEAGRWSEEAIVRGYKSALALPLESDGHVFGALTIYSSDAVAFDASELTLLRELADDLAFGIQALRTTVSQGRAEQALRESQFTLVTANERYARQEAALTALMRRYVTAPDDFTPIVREVTEVVARTLEVAHVSVWRHDDRGTSTRCLDLFESRDNQHSSGMELTEEACPMFFTAIDSTDVIAAHDARSDPRTLALVSGHLEPYGITSMMAVAIRYQGTTVGVLSCTHAGAPRRWTPDEQTFALAVANFVSAITAQVERQRLEQQLRQAQKLEAIGQLAGGVAHDFNNILTVILGRAEEVSVDARLPGDLRDAVGDISQNAERATALTRQLLAFSRRQTIQVRDVDMNAVVGNLTRMLDRILGEDVVVEFHYAPRPAHVRADPGMIEQVLLNLAVNARDAMPLGGHLSIDTAVFEGPSEPGGPVRPQGPWVCLQVTDTGSGIAAEHLPHIFEPFFTTKDVGKGTGLGLATSYGIVQQHGGWIEVDSRVDHGTTFRVFFPHVSAAVLEPAPVATPSPSPRGDETILVVEDEEGVRALVIKVLEHLGYRLLQAQSGPRAIEVWREHGPGIDMLITDIVMPDGMNGIELAERLRRSSPSLKVIYTSGYLADVSRDDIPSRETDAYLAKPFSLPELAQLVRRTLDAREPTGREGAR
jgi:PAS domain S-box-containing protein